MFCQNCGSEIADGVGFCTNCGAAQTGAAQQPMQAGDPQQIVNNMQAQGGYQQGTPTGNDNYKALGIAGMVCGIAGVVCIWFFVILGIILGIVGCALSGLSMKNAAGRPNGMGVAGLVCSIVALAIGVPFCICVFACASGAASTGAAFSSLL